METARGVGRAEQSKDPKISQPRVYGPEAIRPWIAFRGCFGNGAGPLGLSR